MIKKVLESKEVKDMLDMFSKILNISTWIAGPEINTVNKVSKTYREKSAKKELKRIGFVKSTCMPARIEMRKKAIKMQGPQIELCPLKLYVFTAPIYYKGKLIGFFEGDGAKSSEISEELLEKLSNDIGFDKNIVKQCALEGNVKTEEEIMSMIRMVLDTIELWLRLNDKVQTFASDISEISKNITRIARNLQILGINTSIEAARLGTNGNSIGAISNEIKNVGDFVFEQMKLVNEYLHALNA